MNTTVDRRNNTICLRPHWAHFVIKEMPLTVLCAVMAAGWLRDWFHIGEAFQLIGLFLLTIIVCQAIYIIRIRFLVTDEQVVYLHGVMHRETDFMELYRVVDYQERRTFLQQLFCLKDVIIYSMDRNTPVLVIPGIRSDTDLIAEIRNRVETNKKKKGVYEITNRM